MTSEEQSSVAVFRPLVRKRRMGDVTASNIQAAVRVSSIFSHASGLQSQ